MKMVELQPRRTKLRSGVAACRLLQIEQRRVVVLSMKMVEQMTE